MLSHATSRTSAPSRAAAALAFALALLGCAACSSLPSHSWPRHRDHEFLADYVVAEDGRLRLPTSTPEVVVRSLELTPAPRAERFVGDDRWFVYPAGTRVAVRGSLRAYAREDGSLPSLRELLPGARVAAPAPTH